MSLGPRRGTGLVPLLLMLSTVGLKYNSESRRSYRVLNKAFDTRPLNTSKRTRWSEAPLQPVNVRGGDIEVITNTFVCILTTRWTGLCSQMSIGGRKKMFNSLSGGCMLRSAGEEA